MPARPMFEVEVNDQQRIYPVARQRFIQAVQQILTEQGVRRASISIAVVDKATMHALNNRYLQHDEPTDVLSFVLTAESGYLEGEIIVCADVAADAAAHYHWTVQDELLLYVIHGTLHLVGFDDHTPGERQEMRDRERYFLSNFGLTPRYDDPERPAFEKGDHSS
jgi:probable rRNA maturation factor